MPAVTTLQPAVNRLTNDEDQQATGLATGSAAAARQQPAAGQPQARTWSPLPMGQPGQPLPLITPKQPAAAAGPGNDMVIAETQRRALSGAPAQNNRTQGLIEQNVNTMLENPLQGLNAQQYKQQRADTANRNLSQGIEMLRQNTADRSNSGVIQRQLQDTLLRGMLDREQQASDLDVQLAQADQQARLQALAEARAQRQQTTDEYNQGIQQLVAARGAAEGERSQLTAQGFQASQSGLDRAQQLLVQSNDQAGAQALEALRQAGQKGLQVSEQQWQAAENALNRQQQIAVQAGDIAGQKEIAKIQGDLQLQRQIQQQGFDATQATLGRALQESLQANDIAATQVNLEKQLALDKWKTQSGYQFTAAQNALNRDLEQALKTQDIESQQSLVELKAKLDMKQLVSAQNFEAVQADLNRQQAVAMQAGDIAGQIKVLQKKAEYDQLAAKADQEWRSAERTATQSWQTGERLDQNTYDQAQKFLDRAQQLALQTNDISAQKTIEDNRAKLQLQMQTAAMSQEEKMAYLGAQLQEARASNDVNRQMQLIDFQTRQDMTKISQQQGYQAAQAVLDRQFQAARDSKDAALQLTLQRNQLSLQREQLTQEKTLEQARLALQERGFDLAQMQGRYNMIMDASGPDAARHYLSGELSRYGVSVPAPDPLANQKALESDYLDAQLQWALTHKGSGVYDASGAFTGLTNDGAQAFTTWYNDNIYGNKNVDKYLSGEKPVAGLVGGDRPGAENATDYTAVKARASAFDQNSDYSKGQYFVKDGRLYCITSDMVQGGSQLGGYRFDVVDVASGQRGQLNPTQRAGKEGRFSGWQLIGFDSAATGSGTTAGGSGSGTSGSQTTRDRSAGVPLGAI